METHDHAIHDYHQGHQRGRGALSQNGSLAGENEMSLENICGQWPKSNLRPNMNYEVGFERAGHTGRAIRLEPSQVDGLAAVLSLAFYEGPNFRYMIPDDHARLSLLPAFFHVAIRTSQLYGVVHTTQALDGGALWIGPGHALTPGRMVRTGFLSIPFQLGWANFRHCLNLGARLDEVHQRLAGGLHWYLMAHGVEPSKQGGNIGGALIEPVLSRADSEGLPCYLETFNERNLPFYERHGFRIAGSGNIPGGGPDFWAMLRAPHSTY
jgi:hypothetical protein